MEREELLKAARAGDSGALTELLNVCQPEPLDDSVVSDRENVNILHKRLDLRRVLSELDATHREVLLLRDFYGYSSEETAERLGISIEATKSRLHRARSNMRRALSIKSHEDVRQ